MLDFKYHNLSLRMKEGEKVYSWRDASIFSFIEINSWKTWESIFSNRSEIFHKWGKGSHERGCSKMSRKKMNQIYWYIFNSLCNYLSVECLIWKNENQRILVFLKKSCFLLILYEKLIFLIIPVHLLI